MDNKPSGNHGEEVAAKYLKSQGYHIIERNFLIRGGEIDIVAKDGEYLCFIEVKARWSHEYGSPIESMTPWKIKALLRTAQFYLMKTNWGNGPYRLDFVGVDFSQSKDNPTIELIRNITG